MSRFDILKMALLAARDMLFELSLTVADGDQREMIYDVLFKINDALVKANTQTDQTIGPIE